MDEPAVMEPSEAAKTPRRVTMTDVARVAGCSQATVSFVLNDAPGARISPAMRARVIAAARALNYAPTALAHHDTVPVGERGPGVVGFVVDQLATSPEAVVAIEGARLATWDDGLVVAAAQTMNDPAMEEATLRALRRMDLRGVILMTIFTRKVAVPPAVLDLGVPVALLNCYADGVELPSVVPAEAEGGERVGRLLTAAGHRRIGMITGENWMEAARDRARGFRKALAQAGIAHDPALVVHGDWSPSAGHEGARRLLALADRPTAIFCQNDRTAIGCYEAIKEAGLRIPDDVSVVGYDDEEVSRHLFPQLTTVVLPHRMMGQWAVEALSRPRPGTHRMDCPLVERASVRRL